MELAITIRPDPMNPDPGDLMLDQAGREVVLDNLSLEVLQLLTIRFKFFAGEWFANLDEGTPWFQHILVKGPSDRVIRTVLTAVITECPGVAELLRLTYSIGRDRRLSVQFSARLDSGVILNTREFGPFVVDLTPGEE